MILRVALERQASLDKEAYANISDGIAMAAVALENHPLDSRVTISEDDKVQTLTSRMGTGGNNVPLVLKIRSGCEGSGNGTNPDYQNGVIDNHYIVRRLTPTECARLQGFPDWWCDDLGIAEPTDEDIAEWRKIFETHAKALGKKTKPKTDAQIRKWLINPHSDSAEYKMWGNGVALPCVFYVLNSIIENEQEGCL